MEKPPFRQNQDCGDWELKERLGMGGFAHVYLYQHHETNEKLAVKMCRLELTPRNKDRWSREIQIMKKLNHINVVTARDVPEEINLISLNDLPLLAMEYCSRGDLRKLLSKPENCCGLKESEVLSLLNDVGSGIQYLHENKIIHRDLKPENIVLQDINGKLVHKIIDLGYAKDLDQGSLCTSFVGTLQYLAPELFENKPYTVTVDYWSFATMIFECSCGFRPFLHNLQPVQWASKVRNKGPKDIMAVEELNGEVRFSTHLPYPNNISRTLLEPMESLLQLMLKWDPVLRGGQITESKKPLCFEVLERILSMKVVHILNMTTAQVHSYQLAPDESLHSLQKRIETETKIEVVNQELLQETGVSLDPRKPAAQCVLDGVVRTAIEFLDFCIESHTDVIKQNSNNVIFSHKDFGQLCNCKHLPALSLRLSLLRYNTNLTRCKNSMFGFSQQLKAKLDFFKSSIQYDLEKYSDQMHYGICECLHSLWDLGFVLQVAEVSYLDDEIMALHSEIVELQRSPYARRQGDKMEQLNHIQTEMCCIWCIFSAPEPDVSSDSSEMVKAIIQTVQNQDKVLKDLYTHLSKILISKQKIIDLFPRIEKTLESIKEADNTVMQMQIKRQREFWHLLKIACVSFVNHAFINASCAGFIFLRQAQNSSRNSIAASPESSNLLQVSQWSQSAQPVSSPHPLTSLPGPNDKYLIHLVFTPLYFFCQWTFLKIKNGSENTLPKKLFLLHVFHTAGVCTNFHNCIRSALVFLFGITLKIGNHQMCHTSSGRITCFKFD
uniref:Inhibitor of nuclear factor kappa-B kinase subunit alpha n=1 Tax=Sphaeramia orbicularis TaxID=375764 RepID=A0A672YDU2_9TELE